MKKGYAFLQLVRWPNLLFIALTQGLFLWAIVWPIAAKFQVPIFRWQEWVFVMLGSVSIAAAGYIINDYFDVNIDRINKPARLVVDRIIKRRWAMFLHSLLSFIGVALGFYIGFKANVWWLGWANGTASVLLFLYSISWKKKLVIGNVVISLLTAWVVGVMGLYSIHEANQLHASPEMMAKLLRLTLLYSGFAFIISLVREIVKDLEDMKGDSKYGAHTMPLAWGIRTTKLVAGTWLIFLVGILLALQLYVIPYKWYLSIAYATLFIIIPSFAALHHLRRSFVTADFARLSTLIKAIMLSGILSMAFFHWYPL